MAKTHTPAAIVVIVVIALIILAAILVITGSIPAASKYNKTLPTTLQNSTNQSSSPIQILSVVPRYSNGSTANISGDGKGMVFYVAIKNNANVPIYLTGGCNPALRLLITPNGTSSLMPNGAGACAIVSPRQLDPNNETIYTAPEFAYVVIHRPSAISAHFNLTWYTAVRMTANNIFIPNSTPNYLSFSRNFTFS